MITTQILATTALEQEVAVRLASRAVVLTVAVTAVRITANPTWAVPVMQGKARAVDTVATQTLKIASLQLVPALHHHSAALRTGALVETPAAAKEKIALW